MALRAKIQGKIRIRCLIGENGVCSEPKPSFWTIGDFSGRSFVLMDPAGRKRGELAVGPGGHAYLRFYDESGRVTWGANETRAYPVK